MTYEVTIRAEKTLRFPAADRNEAEKKVRRWLKEKKDIADLNPWADVVNVKEAEG